MAGKRPLVDRMVKGALRSWFVVNGDIPFTAKDLFSWMSAQDMIPHSSNNFSSAMVGSRLAYWAKAGKVDGLVVHARHTFKTNSYRMVR